MATTDARTASRKVLNGHRGCKDCSKKGPTHLQRPSKLQEESWEKNRWLNIYFISVFVVVVVII